MPASVHYCEASSCREVAEVLLSNRYGAHVYLCRLHWQGIRGRTAPGLHVAHLDLPAPALP